MGELALKEDPWRKQLDQMRPEWQALFSSQQHLERFRRVVATAINNNPDLLDADRRSLFGAATMAAQDGLMPDGREGALVIYNTKIKVGDREQWIKAVRWMPMVAGVLKKIRQSGELLDISVQVAYAADHFTYQLGDDARITHIPNLDEEDRGELRFVYAIARTKDGGAYREVMSRKQVEQIKASSKSDKGPWKSWYEEMARKSVLRRLAKFLPSGHEIEAMLVREEQEALAAPEAIPVTNLPRLNSSQAKKAGEWEPMVAEIDALSSLEALGDWRAENEARVKRLPDAWQEQVWERLDKRESDLIDADLDRQSAREHEGV